MTWFWLLSVALCWLHRYKKLLSMVDLTKNFFFSYSYRVMRSLQKNVCDDKTGKVLSETMFMWNEFLTRGIRNILQNTIWTVALVYGFFKQVWFTWPWPSGITFSTFILIICIHIMDFYGSPLQSRNFQLCKALSPLIQFHQFMIKDNSAKSTSK